MLLKLKAYLPDEWRSAWASGLRLKAAVKRTAHARTKSYLSLVLPFILAFSLALYLEVDIHDTALAMIITLLGILSGFAMSLMLFTGRVSGAEYLDYESSRLFREKVIYLLWTQVMTLMFFLWALFFSVVLLLSGEGFAGGLHVLDAIVVGALVVGIFRSMLFPYQLVELHLFSLQQLVDGKQDERNKKLQDDLDALNRN